MLDILFTFHSIAPLFVMVGIGIVVRKAGLLQEGHAGILNKLCFYVFIPCMMIKSASSADFSQLTDSWMYLYGLVSIVAGALLLSFIAPKFMSERPKIAALVHSGFRSNTMLLGMPIAVNLLGETEAFPAILMLLLASPVSNACGIFVMSLFGNEERKQGILQSLRSILVNPVTIGLLAGVLIAVFDIPLPTAISEPIASFSSAATPVAMISIGASFRFERLVSDIRYVGWGVFIKLIVLPILFVVPLILLGYRNAVVLGIYLLHATPSASTSGILTEMMGGDGALSNEIIIISTACSAITLFVGVALLRACGVV